MTLKSGSTVTQIIGTDTDRSATYDFLLTLRSNHEPTTYRFRDKVDGDFSRKSSIFPIHRVFYSPTERVPLGIWYRRKGVEAEQRMDAHSSFECGKIRDFRLSDA